MELAKSITIFSIGIVGSHFKVFFVREESKLIFLPNRGTIPLASLSNSPINLIRNVGALILGVFSSGSLGTNGLWPYYVHSSRHPPGFMLTVYFDKNPKGEWFLQAGQASKDMDQRCHTGGRQDERSAQRKSGGRGNDCAMVLAGNGTLDSGVGQWLHLTLSAKRVGNGSTLLSAAIDGVPVARQLVATAPQARGAVALGCGLHHAEFDNLTIVPM